MKEKHSDLGTLHSVRVTIYGKEKIITNLACKIQIC